MKVFFFLFFVVTLSAQTKGVIKDSITGQPIPYVSVWVENETIGTTAEFNGEFVINTNDKNKNLVFSVLGYERKICKVSDAQTVLLNPTALELGEVMIYNKKEKKQVEIGKTSGFIQEAFDNGPRMDAKFFPYDQNYKKTQWISKVTIFTDSKIEDSTIKLHLYEVDENGFPGEELLQKDFIITLKKGIFKHNIDVSKFNLTFPKKGLFVAFEKLIIEKNKVERVITDPNFKTTKIKITYSPLVLYNAVEKDYLFSYSGGKWIKKTKEELNEFSTNRNVYEPNITLILTN
ncbi:carboxypeptidase-like regulatory domain-containing protein [Flavobacterium sp.]|uniref:carboxypeptidase-like regulatory domain-containing protein n=1 Tax=Flavobacterium sp. TaxID=239 RepID=UPI00261B0BBD|nr:carboxypeptidase-like regulatory domain-containing protein [Flavobacterium sp.]MDD3004332.1 carboxypeptidase-like regulatory domain-containing protein [Flavobacterium sp.]